MNVRVGTGVEGPQRLGARHGRSPATRADVNLDHRERTNVVCSATTGGERAAGRVHLAPVDDQRRVVSTVCPIRSCGWCSGTVQDQARVGFGSVEDATKAKGRFHLFERRGLLIRVEFNSRWHKLSPRMDQSSFSGTIPQHLWRQARELGQ